jgi:hypothetical protein
MLNRLLNWLSRLLYGGVKPVSRTGAMVHWVRGIGWMETCTDGILPSKYETPEEREAFKKEVAEATKGANNRIAYNHAGGFPWNPNVCKK